MRHEILEEDKTLTVEGYMLRETRALSIADEAAGKAAGVNAEEAMGSVGKHAGHWRAKPRGL